MRARTRSHDCCTVQKHSKFKWFVFFFRSLISRRWFDRNDEIAMQLRMKKTRIKKKRLTIRRHSDSNSIYCISALLLSSAFSSCSFCCRRIRCCSRRARKLEPSRSPFEHLALALIYRMRCVSTCAHWIRTHDCFVLLRARARARTPNEMKWNRKEMRRYYKPRGYATTMLCTSHTSSRVILKWYASHFVFLWVSRAHRRSSRLVSR